MGNREETNKLSKTDMSIIFDESRQTARRKVFDVIWEMDLERQTGQLPSYYRDSSYPV
jgi:hypothetical protein